MLNKSEQYAKPALLSEIENVEIIRLPQGEYTCKYLGYASETTTYNLQERALQFVIGILNKKKIVAYAVVTISENNLITKFLEKQKFLGKIGKYLCEDGATFKLDIEQNDNGMNTLWYEYVTTTKDIDSFNVIERVLNEHKQNLVEYMAQKKKKERDEQISPTYNSIDRYNK